MSKYRPEGHTARKSLTARERKDKRREEARERQDYRVTLTPAQQLKALDRRLGKAEGAGKERCNLIVQCLDSGVEIEQGEFAKAIHTLSCSPKFMKLLRRSPGVAAKRYYERAREEQAKSE